MKLFSLRYDLWLHSQQCIILLFHITPNMNICLDVTRMVNNPKSNRSFSIPPPAGQVCDLGGSQSDNPDPRGQCSCKRNTQGPTCDTCKAGTFYLHEANPAGCISCFCMGVTDRCSSSGHFKAKVRVEICCCCCCCCCRCCCCCSVNFLGHRYNNCILFLNINFVTFVLLLISGPTVLYHDIVDF